MQVFTQKNNTISKEAPTLPKTWYNVFGTTWRVAFALKKGGGSMTAYEILSPVIAFLTLIETIRKR